MALYPSSLSCFQEFLGLPFFAGSDAQPSGVGARQTAAHAQLQQHRGTTNGSAQNREHKAGNRERAAFAQMLLIANCLCVANQSARTQCLPSSQSKEWKPVDGCITMIPPGKGQRDLERWLKPQRTRVGEPCKLGQLLVHLKRPSLEDMQNFPT